MLNSLPAASFSSCTGIVGLIGFGFQLQCFCCKLLSHPEILQQETDSNVVTVSQKFKFTPCCLLNIQLCPQSHGYVLPVLHLSNTEVMKYLAGAHVVTVETNNRHLCFAHIYC